MKPLVAGVVNNGGQRSRSNEDLWSMLAQELPTTVKANLTAVLGRDGCWVAKTVAAVQSKAKNGLA